MPAATVEMPVPNATTEVGLPGSVVRARIEPEKLDPFRTLASITSEIARGRSARSEPSMPLNLCKSVPLMSYTARMALGVSVRAASEPAPARPVLSATMPAPVLVSTNSSASPTGAELNRVIRNAAVDAPNTSWMIGSCMLWTDVPEPNAARRNVSFPSPMRAANSRADHRPDPRALRESDELFLSDLLQPWRREQHSPRDDAAPRDVHRRPQLALGSDDFQRVVDAVGEAVDAAPRLDAHHLADLRRNRCHVAAARGADLREPHLVRLLDSLGLGANFAALELALKLAGASGSSR